MILCEPKNREEWLENRFRGIGGSDAACVLGLNKYKTNTQLWNEKRQHIQPPDISDKPAVKYGKEAECYLREMFKLDFQQYNVDYDEFRMYANDKYPFIYATLDGEITEPETGRKGILEIKTTTIQNKNQWSEWEDRVPENYYIQLLHQLLATGWDFAILKAHIRYKKSDDIDGFRATERHYYIDRKSVENDIEFLLNEEVKFWESLKENKSPSLRLPEI
jgi:putative phage-type endonuclease